MKRSRVIGKFIALLLLLTFALPAQQKRTLLLNATAHVGNGTVIEKSAIIVVNGTIVSVEQAPAGGVPPERYDTVIDFSGKHIYPALINCNNILGLHDAEAVRATRDFAEVGRINPHVRALIAYNTDNIVIPTVRTNGVLYTQVTPRAGLMSGSSSVMSLVGWNWEDAVLKADDGVHLTFPKMVVTRFNDEDETITKNANKNYHEELNFLEKFFVDARAYLDEKQPKEKNLRFEAMRGVLTGESRLYLHADYARDILAALSFAERHRIKHPVIVGGADAWKVTLELKSRRVPVMLNRVNDLPGRADDDVDLVYRMPYLLQRDSVLFCIQLEGDMEAMHSRNLPFNAGAAVAYGLTKEQALSAITLNAARIMGVDKHIGSIEPGKLASLVVSNGDILDMRTSQVVFAMVAGRPVPLTNKQVELYERYRLKYGVK